MGGQPVWEGEYKSRNAINSASMAKHDLHLHLPKVIVDGRDSSIRLKRTERCWDVLLSQKAALTIIPGTGRRIQSL